MRAVVTRLFSEGRSIPRWERGRLQAVTGELHHDLTGLERLAQPNPHLRLSAETGPLELLHPIYVRIRQSGMVFRG